MSNGSMVIEIASVEYSSVYSSFIPEHIAKRAMDWERPYFVAIEREALLALIDPNLLTRGYALQERARGVVLNYPVKWYEGSKSRDGDNAVEYRPEADVVRFAYSAEWQAILAWEALYAGVVFDASVVEELRYEVSSDDDLFSSKYRSQPYV